MIQKRNFIGLLTLIAVFFYAPLTYSQTKAAATETAPVKADTTPPKAPTKSKLFEESATDSDYLMAIEKAGEVLESAHKLSLIHI